MVSSMTRRIICLCPSDGISGGPEALHQLCDAINRLGGTSAMLYCPDDQSSRPRQYDAYDSPSTLMSDIEVNDFLIFPEPWHRQVISEFDSAIWWLAVPPDHADAAAARVDFHFTQSAFAKHILSSHGGSGIMLSDYVDSFFCDIGLERIDIASVNPAKGFNLAHSFRDMYGIQMNPLYGIGKQKMLEELNKSKVYIEFGHNPGKDRIPREAAMCGNVVFMNRSGAGCFYDDYQLDEWFTFDKYSLEDLNCKLHLVFNDYENYLSQQKQFREAISAERSRFDDEVKNVLKLIC